MTKQIFWTILLTVGFSIPGSGQGMNKFGKDEQACGKNYTIYFEHYKLKEYDLALPFWKKTVDICPAFSVSLWKSGEKMYKQLLSKATDQSDKEAYLDTLLWIYDQRILYFGSDPRAGKGYVLGKKGVTQMKYESQSVSDAYQNLLEAQQIEKLNTKPDVILNLIKASIALYEEGQLDEHAVLTNYQNSQEIIKTKREQIPGDKRYEILEGAIERIFIGSGAANCDALTSLYAEQLPGKKTDVEWIANTMRQLKKSGCTENELYLDLFRKKIALDPSGSEAHQLAQILLKEEQIKEALEYLEKSREIGIDDNQMAETAYELAYIYYQYEKDYEKAQKYAKEATRIRPEWGDPYILTGRIYIDGRQNAFTDEFQQTAAIWAAVDQFVKAKQVDSSANAKANILIKTYSALFPLTETLFFYTLKKGDSYKVGSWINETTTVRARD